MIDPTNTWLDIISHRTDENDHWRAAGMIAALYGTGHERLTIAEYWSDQERRGHSLAGEIATRDGIINAILARLPEVGAAAIRKAL